MNKTFAVFANGGTMTTAQTALWQYDYGQILVVQGIELPTAYEVQFCNAGDSTTITSVGDSTGVVIPDQFLQNGETIYAYIYLHTGNADGETEYKITIPVMDRAEPTDIEPTPQQESTIGQLIAALNAGVEAAEEAAEKGPRIIDGDWYTWDADAGEFVNTDVKAEGEDGEPGTPGVGVPSGGTTGQVLKKASGTDYDTEWADESGGGGTSDYSDLSNKPSINSVTLSGNKSLSDLGAEPEALVVHVTQSGSTYSADKTYDQIMAAVAADKRVVAVLNGVEYQLASAIAQEYTVAFAAVRQGMAYFIYVVYASGVYVSTAAIGTYSKPSGGIPATDLASAVQTSLGKADTALQTAPVTSVNGQTGAVTVPEPFVVTYSTSDMTAWTCDKTFAQIAAAIAAGTQVVMLGSVGGTPIAQGCDILLSTDGVRYYIEFWIRWGRNNWYRIEHDSNDSITMLNGSIEASDVGAVAVAQGVSHAGEFVVVGSDGDVTTMSLSTWSAGSY